MDAPLAVKAAEMKKAPRAEKAHAEPVQKNCAEALFQAYYDRLCWFATSYLGNLNAAEDVVQEVFLQICKQRRRRTLRDPKAYLFRAVRNRALNECRRKGSARRSDRDVSTLAGADQPCTDERVTCSEMRGALCKRADQLSERQREVFVLGCVEGFTHAEIADVLGLSTKTVSTHMERAKKALREKLEMYR